MSYVIFSIDNEGNPFSMNVFKGYLADEGIADVVLPRVGSYHGIAENCFICSSAVFDEHIRGTVYVRGQESFLHVASGNKMEAWLEYQHDREDEALGHMHAICKEEAMQCEAWHHDPATGNYWTAKAGNPDNSYRESVAKYRN